MQITGTDFVTIPTQDANRAREFYTEVLGLRRDSHGEYEVWAGNTCFALFEPESAGMQFHPSKAGHIALHVDDVVAAKAELEAKGVQFSGDVFDTSVCHMALFRDPDGNALMLHNRYAPTRD